MSLYFICNKNKKGEPFFELDGTRCIKTGKRDEARIAELAEVPVIKALCEATTPEAADAALQAFHQQATQDGLTYSVEAKAGQYTTQTLAFYKSRKQAPSPSVFGSNAGRPSSVEDMQRWVNPPAAKCAIM
jgi:hypothetical protein